MINLDTTYIKPFNRRFTVPRYQSIVNKIHKSIITKTAEGYEFLGWVDWPENYYKDEFKRIISVTNNLKEKGIKKLLVIGIGGSSLGPQAAINFVKGAKKDSVLFVGTDMSASNYVNVEEQLKNEKWAICIISKSGTTLEPSLAFRHFSKLLEKSISPKKNINDYIIAITDKSRGLLKKAANEEKYESFIIPDEIGGRFSGLTAVGLIPMAFSGIDIEKVMKGAQNSRKKFLSTPSLQENEAYMYAVIRYYLHKKRFSLYPDNSYKDLPIHYQFKFDKKLSTELLVTWDVEMQDMTNWITQLACESEGKNGRGLFVTSTHFSRDLHSLGQLIQEGNKNFFETIFWINKKNHNITIKNDIKNNDNLNYLVGKNLNEINKIAYQSTLKVHAEQAKINCLIIEIENTTPEALGYFWYFYFISISMSAYLLKINPFNQPGVEAYKKEMNSNLGN